MQIIRKGVNFLYTFLSGVSVWVYVAVAALILLIIALIIWMLKRWLTLYQKDASANPWATKKEVKKNLKITTTAGAYLNMAKYSLLISIASAFMVITAAKRLFGITPSLYAYAFLVPVFFGCVFTILRSLSQYIKQLHLPDYPKGKEKIYSWLQRKLTPSKDFYYIGKAFGMKVGLPRSKRCEHILICGPTGAMKSSAFIIPQLLLDADGHGSAFCPDAKSPEIFDTVAGRWLAKGKKVFLFDPWDERCRGFNPLHNADDEDISSMVDVFLQEREDVLKEQGFFKDRTREYLFSILKLVRLLDEKYCNLVTVYKITESVSLLEQFIHSVHDDNIVRKFHDFLKMTNTDKINTLSNIRGKLNIFLDPKVCAAFSRSDFTLDAMFKEKDPCLLVVGSPVSKSETGQKIASLITNLLIKRALQEKQLGDRAKSKGSKRFEHGGLHIYGDEIRSLRITGLANVISISRYARTQILVTSTDMAFFRYYQQDVGSIMTNLRTNIFLPGINEEDAKMVSNRIGKVEMPEYKYIRNPITGASQKQMVGFEQKPAMPVSDIIYMPRDRALVFTPGLKPFVVKIESIHKTRWLKKLVYPSVLKKKLFKAYKRWGINTAPLETPDIPMIDLQFCDMKSVKKTKKQAAHKNSDFTAGTIESAAVTSDFDTTEDAPLVISDIREGSGDDDVAAFMP